MSVLMVWAFLVRRSGSGVPDQASRVRHCLPAASSSRPSVTVSAPLPQWRRQRDETRREESRRRRGRAGDAWTLLLLGPFSIGLRPVPRDGPAPEVDQLDLNTAEVESSCPGGRHHMFLSRTKNRRQHVGAEDGRLEPRDPPAETFRDAENHGAPSSSQSRPVLMNPGS